MGRRKKPENVFGPSLQDAIFPGDIFSRSHEGKLYVFVCVGKVYHDDLTVSYRFTKNVGPKKTSIIHESTFEKASLYGYRRIFKTPRKELKWSNEKPVGSTA